MALGFAGALGRGAIQAARGAARARPTPTLSALRAGQAEIIQSGVGSRAGLPALPRPRPPSEVPWTPATQSSDLLGGSPDATALFMRTRLELGLAEMSNDPTILRKVIDNVIKEGRLSQMGRDEADVLAEVMEQIAQKVGLKAAKLSDDLARELPGSASTTAFRSIGNRNSVDNALNNIQNERQISELYEFAVKNVDLSDKNQRTWFNSLLIKIESKTDELVKQSLLRELRTSPRFLEQQVFPPEVKAQLSRILKIKPEDLYSELTSPEQIVEMFYNSRASRSFGSAALPGARQAFDPAKYISAIRSSFKPQEIESIRKALNTRYSQGLLTPEQVNAIKPVFKIQEEAVAKGRFNRMIDYFERQAKGPVDSIRSDVQVVRQLNDADFIAHQEQMRVRKGRGPRRPSSDDAMPMEDGKGPRGYSWGGPEGNMTLERFLTERLGEGADERSRAAARAFLNKNLPQNDPYMRTKPMRLGKNNEWKEVPLDEYKRMGPEAREVLKFERVPITHTEAGLAKPYKISRANLDVGDRSPQALLAKQDWIDSYGYQRALEMKEARTMTELKDIWRRVEIAKVQDFMDEGFFNILLNAYKEKALKLQGRLSTKARGGRGRQIDRPTVEDLYRTDFTDMDEMLNYQGLVRSLRVPGVAPRY